MARHSHAAAVRRTTIDLDMAELERARTVLGTSTNRETVNEALRQVNRMAALRRAAAIVRSGELGVPDPQELSELRRPRFEP